jgi:mono/diheme cytochrome c family protein
MVPISRVGAVLPLLAATVLCLSTLPARAANPPPAAEPPPYTVKGNKVDEHTYKGFLYYGDECFRCHGPGGEGSSYAPALTDSLKRLTKDQFEETVINGKKEVNTANDKVMPAFGLNPDVTSNLENIYSYLKARSDGVLGREHPEHLEQ